MTESEIREEALKRFPEGNVHKLGHNDYDLETSVYRQSAIEDFIEGAKFGYNQGVKTTLAKAAQLATPNVQNCITVTEVEILQLENKLILDTKDENIL